MSELMEDVIKRFIQHIKDLEAEGFAMHPNWFWYPDEVHKLKEIDENLLKELEEVHKFSPTFETYTTLKQILETLHKDLAVMTNQHPDEKIQRTEREIIEKFVSQIESTAKSMVGADMINRRLELLRMITFPVDSEKNLAHFLVVHWEETMEMAKATFGEKIWELIMGEDSAIDDLDKRMRNSMPQLIKTSKEARLFSRGLPMIRDRITTKTLPDVVRLAKAAGPGAGSLFESGLPAVRHIIMPIGWPVIVDDLCEMAEAAGRNAGELFEAGLPAVKDLITPETWPELVKMAKAGRSSAHTLFGLGLVAVKDIIREKPWTWPGMVDMANVGGNKARFLFQFGVPAVKDFITPETWPMIMKGLVQIAESIETEWDALAVFGGGFAAVKHIITPNTWQGIVKQMIKIGKAAGQNTGPLFHNGLPTVSKCIRTFEDFEKISEGLIGLLHLFKGAEKPNFEGFKRLEPSFSVFGLNFFDSFVLPVAKSQTVVSFHIFESYSKLRLLHGNVMTEKDTELVLHIAKSYLKKANVILQDIIIKGIEKNVVKKPIGGESDIIKAFLKRTPAYIVDLYPLFRRIWLGDSAARDINIELMFKDVKKLKEEMFQGELSKDYLSKEDDKEVFYSVLYYVFAPYDMTKPKEDYIRSYEQRQDRQSDIPAELQGRFAKPISVRISSGSHELKKGEEVDITPWDLIARAVSEVHDVQQKELDVAALGFELLQAVAGKDINEEKRYRFIKALYLYSYSKGESLPKFYAEHGTLMRYKEYVGDRVKNDILAEILKSSIVKDPQRFQGLHNQILNRKIENVDYSRLAKSISAVVLSNQSNDQKKKIIYTILEKNGFHVPDVEKFLTDEHAIEGYLEHAESNIIEKGVVSKIFIALYEKDYEKMQYEMENKFEHKTDLRSFGGKPYLFLLSKKKVHCCAMYNFGVCVAPDDILWNSPDFWQLIIFDEDYDAHGGAIIRTIDEDGKRYLVLSIQPTSSILERCSPPQVLDKIIQYGILMAKKLKYDHVLIPTNQAILSNRGSIQQAISKRFGNTKKEILKREYEFSYNQYKYKYQEFFVAWSRPVVSLF